MDDDSTPLLWDAGAEKLFHMLDDGSFMSHAWDGCQTSTLSERIFKESGAYKSIWVCTAPLWDGERVQPVHKRFEIDVDEKTPDHPPFDCEWRVYGEDTESFTGFIVTRYSVDFQPSTCADGWEPASSPRQRRMQEAAAKVPRGRPTTGPPPLPRRSKNGTERKSSKLQTLMRVILSVRHRFELIEFMQA